MKPPVRWRNCSRSRRMAGDDSEDDPLAALKADVRTARGKALLVETVAAGWGEGATAAPRRDWTASRLGPSPPAALAEIRRDSFAHVLASTGTPPSLFVDADGTAQREAVRRWHLGTVLPLARILESELTVKLEAAVRPAVRCLPAGLGRARSSVPEARRGRRDRYRGADDGRALGGRLTSCNIKSSPAASTADHVRRPIVHELAATLE